MDKDMITRRGVLRGTGLLAGGLLAGAGLVGGVALGDSGPQVLPLAGPEKRPATPDEAWAALREGNRRWVSGAIEHPRQDAARRVSVAQKQAPYAVVLSCIDSRVPPELVFDAGLGDLMVVRTAAQTIDPLVTGAAEYGPAELEVPLVVVLGHQRCGAVTAASEALRTGKKLPGELQHIVSALRPAYKSSGGDIEAMVKANTVNVVNRLRADALLAPRIAKRRLKVIGAHYSLDSGEVTRVV
jgi:carbonic anhydrase